ncbi:epiplakin [Paroedura picta]|uniref:epiplakin n=1 Tax=Paroedura picta TaxID=143630 RepID=UPI004055CB9C
MEPRELASEHQHRSTALPGGCRLPRATAAGQAGPDITSIAGVYLEASTKAMSLYDAVQEHYLQPDLALPLLEAQAATGGIVDWRGKQLLPVVEALRLELVGLEMKERLLAAERARTGFVDPYMEEKVSLYQAIQKELIGREQGVGLLDAQIATGGLLEPSTGRRLSLQEACERGCLGEEMRDFLSDPGNEAAKGFWDPNTNQKVTYVELMRRCIADPASSLLLLPLKISFPGLRGGVCSHELLDSGIIDSALFKALHSGEITAQEVAEMDSVQRFLSGTSSIAGVALLDTSGCRSIYQASAEHLLVPGTAVALLQAQAATGCLIDPVTKETFTAEAAVQAGLVGPELHEAVSAAERAVTGYKDPFTGEVISLFQAIQKGLVARDPGIFLLDAQLATGGIVDPHTHHRLPVEVACQRGLLDKHTHALLCSPTDGIRGFFEPRSKETLSYAELLSRCVTDPETGLSLLPLSGDPCGAHAFISPSTRLALKDTQVPVTWGKSKGGQKSLWKLLFSDHVTGEQRRSLAQQFHSGALSTQALADIICNSLCQAAAHSEVTFDGLREKVTPAQLLSSKIISQDLFEKLSQGEALAKDVVGMGTVKKYLEGTGSIGGLILPDSEERISIYQAKRKGFLRPGTSLILLEAQAATGYLIDPAANKKYSVEEALRANLIGPEVYDKLLAAEKAVTGYTDPYTGSKISLFQAMMKDLIVREHAIRLLEAQIATGGIIDPVNSHRLPVEAAYQRGYFDKKMNLILSDPSDDTKGFFDPNTHENLTYLQLKEKCFVESSTGLCLLPLNSKRRQFIDAATKQALGSSWLFVKHGRFKGQRVSAWDLLNSEYFSEGKRREIFNHYHLHMVSLEQIKLLLEEEMKKWARIKFPALRGHVSAYHLMESGILGRDLFERLLEGAVSPEEVLRMDAIRNYLYGTGSIGGVVLQPSQERVGLYEAMKRNLVLPGVVLPLLEAQAATGFLLDPVNSQKVCLEDAVKDGLVGPELYDKLQRAEEAVTGYKDPFTGKKVSLFQAMKKGLVPDTQAVRLLDAQMSTGGVIDPHRGHHVPLEFAQKKGYIDEKFSHMLSHSSSDAKTFPVLDSKENVTYSQLLDRCQQDEGSGFHLLPLSQTAQTVCTDEQMEHLFRETLVEEKRLTLWDLLNSGYFTEEQRRDFFEKFRSEAISLQQLIHLLLRLVEDMEMKAQGQVTFQGLRGRVPAVWLLDNGILSEQTFAELVQGRKTAEEVAEMESVKRYLQGTGSIAGVFIQGSQEKMGIYQAMQRNLLMPGLGARLLEAQAATGSIVGLGSNQRLSVEEATKAGVVGQELTERLLQAERALIGYRDPYSGRPISVFQAIRKELVPAVAGIPLLEAQLATGGVIDPIHHHHLPLQAAYKHGFYDEEMHKSLSQTTDDSCVFFDPNAQESLTYQQLKDRCIRDPASGLLLLPLSEDAAFCGDKQMMEVLKSETVCVSTGRFKGQAVSLWDLLNSEYISHSKRREILKAYKEEDAEALQEVIRVITTVIAETETQGKRFTFKGLRKQVSASDLFQAELIDKETLDELHQGKKTVQEVTEMDSVRMFLEGCNFIAGVLVQPGHEKMGIYQAMRQGLLRPGMALVLLEAQAATGFLIDPVENKKLSVDEGMATGLIGREIYEKLLSAERAVTGYTHPYTKEQISLFEAMNEELIVRSHGIRLLEAQIATGGIIDPVHSHRIPVEVAYKRGFFDETMSQILSDPTDDTKGFFDPNTQENLTYLQLLERCIQDPETGLYMLQIVRRGERYFYIDETTKQFLQARSIQMCVGRYKGQSVSIWDLLCSPYIQEQRRKDLVKQYKCGMLTLEELISTITTIIEDTEQRTRKLKVKGLRGEVSVAELFNAEIIDKKTLDSLQQGGQTLNWLTQKESVRRYLEGTGGIAGVSVASKTMTIYEAMKTGLLSPENGLVLLEAQAAMGFLTDPLKKKTFSVDQAVLAGIAGDEIHEKLLWAEKAVTGYTDPATGNKLSLFQAMKKNMVEKAYALRLLEAQLATGGILDPEYGHRIPVEVAYKRGYLEEDILVLLSDPEYGIKGFVDPNTHERITYAQLLQRCVRDKETGMYLIQLLDKSEYFYVDGTTKNILSSTKVNVKLGKYAGQILSVWELLCSDYFSEEKRKELIKKYKQGSSVILQRMTTEILNIIEETERNRRDIWFQGLRQQVTASELFRADIISQDTIKKLEEGRQTIQEVANMDSVRRYLEGTSCVAGVLVPSQPDPSKLQRMAIYEAMWKGILRPGTALVLLEAQAATGFIIDPLKNEKLSVDDAVSAGLVGGEIHSKLLAAEKAVTGYTDPYTGKRISLFQAMKRDLIIKEHGIRLLEAQIATGGIIDPVNSHRIPVEVAYKRGYFDEHMNQVLSDPTDDTKGFFDPNTHENLTYMQLLKRCTFEPDTGLLMLQIKGKGFGGIHSEENIRKTLKANTINVGLGQFQDRDVSLWELLFSTYISQYKRQQLLEDYKNGEITLREITIKLKTIIEEIAAHDTTPHKEENNTIQNKEHWSSTLQKTNMKIEQDLQDKYISVWDVLFSQTISEDKREELLSNYRKGQLTLEKLTEILASLLADTEGRLTPDPRAPDTPRPARASVEEEEGADVPDQGEKESVLKGRMVEITVGEFRGRKVSLWDLLHSKYIPEEKRKEILHLYKMGILSIDQMETVVTGIVNRTEEEKMKEAASHPDAPRAPDTPRPAMASVEEEEGTDVPDQGEKESVLKGRMVEITVGEFRGRKFSLWDLLHSKYIPEEKRKEILHLYKTGILSIDQMETVVTGIVNRTEEEKMKEAASHADAPRAPDTPRPARASVEEEEGADVPDQGEKESVLKGRMVEITVGEFRGRKVSLWDLLHSKYIPEEKRKEILHLYKTGILSIDQMETVVTGIVNRTEEEKMKEAASHTDAPSSWEDTLRNHTVFLHVGEFQGREASLWDLLFSQYIPDSQREELLTKYWLGIFSIPDMIAALTSILTGREGSHVQSAGSALSSETTLSQAGGTTPVTRDQELEWALQALTANVPVGEFQGCKVSVWELLFSKYVTVEKRQELVEMFQSGAISSEELIRIIITLIEETEERSNMLKFPGLRRQVTASELFSSQIIDQSTLSDLTRGAKTVEEITEMDSVKRYLEGTSCIAGVLVPSKLDPSKLQRMTIYEAMWKGILRPGTALVLLEAQAATGFIIDPLKNEKLSVDDAVSAGLVGAELQEKLLSAERAVTGYKDPYTGSKISLFQAMNKGLIVKDHGIRLLEAQIATGGIIDPVHSHRLPVEMAYKRGYFDEEMNQILSDPTDDTKGFFDPNTHENLTYMQLRLRCIPDQDTGLLMLHLMGKSSLSLALNDNTRKDLQAAKTTVDMGMFQGQEVSIWDLLLSRYISSQKRQELLRQYKAGTITLQDLIQILTATVTEAEERNNRPTVSHKQPLSPPRRETHKPDATRQSQEEDWEKALKTMAITVPAGEHQGRQVFVWDLLFSSDIAEEKRTELLGLYSRGILPMDQMIDILSTLVMKKELTTRKLDIQVRSPAQGRGTDEKAHVFSPSGPENWENSLRSHLIQVPRGGLQIQQLSLWDVLFSQTISEDKREELLSNYRKGQLTLEKLTKILASLLAETEGRLTPDPRAPDTPRPARASMEEEEGADVPDQGEKESVLEARMVEITVGEFRGRKVSLWDLLHSKYIPEEKRKEILHLYKTGILSIDQMETVVTGIVNRTEEEKMKEAASHAEAPRAPDTPRPAMASVEEEEGADVPDQGEKESVLKGRMVEITVGEFRGRKVSLWDLLHSKYIPEEKRKEILHLYKTGILSIDQMETVVTGIVNRTEEEKMKEAASHADAPRAPDTPRPAMASVEEEEGADVPDQGEKESVLKGRMVEITVGEFRGRKVSLWDLLHSKYIPEEKRKEILHLYKTGILSIDQMETVVTGIVNRTEEEKMKEAASHADAPRAPDTPRPAMASVEEEESADVPDQGEKESVLKGRMVEITVGEFRGRKVSLWDLLHSKYIPEEKRKEILHLYKTGILSIDQMETVVTGIVNRTEEEKMKEEASHPDAPSSWEDPLRNHTVFLHVGEFQGREASLWDLLFSQYIPDSQREELLTKYWLGIFSIPDMIAVLTSILTGREGSHVQSAGSGLSSETTLSQAGGTTPVTRDQELEWALQALTANVPVGEFQGCKVSVWELLFSKYVTVEKRQELVETFQSGAISAEELIRIIITLIEETEERSNMLKFPGLRRQVTASELFSSQIIDQSTLSDLTRGAKTVEEITEMDSVKRYLEGTSCIAGVLVPSKLDPSKLQRMTIYEAMWKGILRPGTALVLLEAQAATGFIIDPLKNEKLSVDDAVSAGLVGAELQEKLLSAERAVTGYKDPYTGSKISLFQAMNKGLIVKDHGIRLLEAQIATGGIIDPVHSHRLPVEMAYKRGYFDEEMNQILSDPTDDTKGFFDPNTHENLTYMQLRLRCIPDQDTGLLMLHLMGKSSLSLALNDNTRKDLQAAKTTVDMGMFQGQEVSIWDLLLSRYISSQKRQELLRQYKAGTITLQDLIQILTATVTEAEERNNRPTVSHKQSLSPPRRETHKPDATRQSQEEDWEKALKTMAITVPAGEHQGRQVFVWDLLFSSDIAEEKRTELLGLYSRGILPMDQMIDILSTLVMKKELTTRKLDIQVRSPAQGRGTDEKAHVFSPSGPENWENSLRSHLIQVPRGGLQIQQLSLWDVLFSQTISEDKREELLSNYRKGQLTLEKLTEILASLLADTEGRLTPDPRAPDTPRPARASVEEEEGADVPDQGEKESVLKGRMVEITVGEFRGRKVSLWDLLHSKYIPEEKRKEILHLYKMGILSIDQMETVVTGIVNRTEEEKMKEAASHADAPRAPDTPRPAMASMEEEEGADVPDQGEKESVLKGRMVEITVGEFRGRKVSLWDLLHSKYIPEEKRKEILHLYKMGILSIDQMETVVTGIVNRTEEEKMKEAASHPDAPRAPDTPRPARASVEEEEGADVPDQGEKESVLKGRMVEITVGEFRGRKVSLWDLLHSKYIPEEKRKEILHLYKMGILSIDQMETVVTGIVNRTEEEKMKEAASHADAPRAPDTPRPAMASVEEEEGADVPDQGEKESVLKGRMVEITVGEFRGRKVSLWDLLHSKYIPEEKRKEILHLYKMGILSIDQMETVVTGIVNRTEEEKMKEAASHPDAPRAPDTPRPARASVEEEEGADVPDQGEKESVLKGRMVEITVGEFRGRKVSLWDLLHSKYIPEEKRKEILHLYKMGILSIDQMETVVTGIVNRTEEEKMKEAASHPDAPRAPDTPRPAMASMEEEEGADVPDQGEKESVLKGRMVEITVGEFRGRKVSLWDLLHSKYIPEEKRKEILHLYKTGILSIDQMETVVTGIVNRTEEETIRKATSRVKCGPVVSEEGECVQSSYYDLLQHSLRLENIDVTIRELQGQKSSVWDPFFSQFVSNILTEEVVHRHGEPAVSVKESIRSITTVITGTESLPFAMGDNTKGHITPPNAPIPSASEAEKENALKSRMLKGSFGELFDQQVSLWDVCQCEYISEEKKKELLHLFMTGMLTTEQLETILTTILNKKAEGARREGCHSVLHAEIWEDSLQNHIVVLHGGGFQGQEISLWDLLFSQYIPETKREELLISYRYGNLSLEEMTEILASLLADSTARVSGLPNAPDIPRSAMVSSEEKEEDVSNGTEQEEMERALKACMVEITVGEFRGRKVSLWDLLHSKYIPEEKRKEILHLYKTGILSIDQMETVVTGIVNRTEEEKMKEEASHPDAPRAPDTPRPAKASVEEEEGADVPDQGEKESILKGRMVEITVGEFRVRKVSLWDLLHSKYIPEEKRKEILHLYKTGILSIDQMETVVTGIVNRTEEEKMKEAASHPDAPRAPDTPRPARASVEEEEGADVPDQGEKESVLKGRMVEITVGEFRGRKISLWDLLHSKYVPEEKRKEILHLYKTGILSIDQMETVVTGIINRTEEEKMKEAASHPDAPRAPDTPRPARASVEEEEGADVPDQGEKESVLKGRMVEITVGEFRGRKVSLWDLLHSKYIPEEKRKEILHLYKMGILSIDQMETVVTGIVNRTEEEKMKEAASHPDAPRAPDTPRPARASMEEEEGADVPDQGEKESVLKGRMVEITVGEFRGRKVSLWDLLHSKYIPEEKWKEILHLYKTGILSIDQMETVVTGIVNRTEEETEKSGLVSNQHKETKPLTESPKKDCGHSLSLETELRSASSVVPVGDFQGQTVSCWDLLFSRYISEDKRQELLSNFRANILSVHELISTLTSLITEAHRQDWPPSPGGPLPDGPEEKDGSPALQQQQLKKSLRTTMVHVTSGQFKGQNVCVLDLLFSKYVSQDKRQELLELYRAGALSIQDMVTMISTIIEEAEPEKVDLKRKLPSRKGTLTLK